MTHMTPAQQRSELAGIIHAASEAIELMGLYEDTYADEVSREISRLVGEIGVRGHVLRRRHIAAHKRNAAFADSVLGDLDRITAGGDKHTDHDEWLDDWHKTEEDDT